MITAGALHFLPRHLISQASHHMVTKVVLCRNFENNQLMSQVCLVVQEGACHHAAASKFSQTRPLVEGARHVIQFWCDAASPSEP